MGEVWAAVNESTGGEVAVKLLRNSCPEHRQRLLREARVCAKLRHKNVIAVHDVGETAEGDPVLIMELLHGETLAEHLERSRRLPQERAAQIARDVARALSAAHRAGIIHRDLKPANVFLHREDGEDDAVVKVLDFGVSKDLDRSELTKAGFMLGSAAYMSPEQTIPSRRIDHRSDLWSLGVVLFQMLTGKRPFAGDATLVLVRIATEVAPAVSQLIANVDPALDAVVAGCLERDVDRRVGSADELVALLDRFVEPARTIAGPPSTPQPIMAPVWQVPLPPELQTISAWIVPAPDLPPPAPVPADDDEPTRFYEPPRPQPPAATGPGALELSRTVQVAPAAMANFLRSPTYAANSVAPQPAQVSPAAADPPRSPTRPSTVVMPVVPIEDVLRLEAPPEPAATYTSSIRPVVVAACAGFLGAAVLGLLIYVATPARGPAPPPAVPAAAPAPSPLPPAPPPPDPTPTASNAPSAPPVPAPIVLAPTVPAPTVATATKVPSPPHALPSPPHQPPFPSSKPPPLPKWLLAQAGGR